MRLSSLLLLAPLAACASPAPPPPPPLPAPSPPGSSAFEALSAAPATSSPPAASSAPPPAPPVADDRPALPPGFVYVEEDTRTACGGLQIDLTPETDGEKGQSFVRVLRPDGTTLHEVHGQRYKLEPSEPDPGPWRQWLSVEFCGDLTGDGVPELVLTEKTMGAHCCYTHHVVSLASPIKRLLTWEKGDMGTPLLPAKYREGADWQIEAQVVVWPPFNPDKGDPSVAYAGAPVVPAVFSLQGDRYQLTSLAFPAAYRKSRDAIHASCQGGNSPDCDAQMIAWIDSLVIGDWATERKRPMYRELLPAYNRRAEATRRVLERDLGTVKAPARLTAPR